MSYIVIDIETAPQPPERFMLGPALSEEEGRHRSSLEPLLGEGVPVHLNGELFVRRRDPCGQVLRASQGVGEPPREDYRLEDDEDREGCRDEVSRIDDEGGVERIVQARDHQEDARRGRRFVA